MFISSVDGLYTYAAAKKGWHSDECPLSCLPSPRWDNWASWRPPRHQPSYPHLPQTQWTSCQPGNQDLATQRLSFWRIKTIAPHILYESVYIFFFILIPHLLTLHIWASWFRKIIWPKTLLHMKIYRKQLSDNPPPLTCVCFPRCCSFSTPLTPRPPPPAVFVGRVKYLSNINPVAVRELRPVFVQYLCKYSPPAASALARLLRQSTVEGV